MNSFQTEVLCGSQDSSTTQALPGVNTPLRQVWLCFKNGGCHMRLQSPCLHGQPVAACTAVTIVRAIWQRLRRVIPHQHQQIQGARRRNIMHHNEPAIRKTCHLFTERLLPAPSHMCVPSVLDQANAPLPCSQDQCYSKCLQHLRTLHHGDTVVLVLAKCSQNHAQSTLLCLHYPCSAYRAH